MTIMLGPDRKLYPLKLVKVAGNLSNAPAKETAQTAVVEKQVFHAQHYANVIVTFLLILVNTVVAIKKLSLLFCCCATLTESIFKNFM